MDLVQWDRVFSGYCQEDLKSVSVVINNNETPISFHQKEVHVPANICKQFSVAIKIINNKRIILRSDSRTYNKEMRYTIYRKMLKATVSSWICLKKPGVVTVLDPLEKFAACVSTRSDVEGQRFSQKGQSGGVRIELVNSHPDLTRYPLDAYVRDIKECPVEATTQSSSTSSTSSRETITIPSTSSRETITIPSTFSGESITTAIQERSTNKRCAMSKWSTCDFLCDSPKIEIRKQALLSGVKHCPAFNEEKCNTNCTGRKEGDKIIIPPRTLYFWRWERH